jgi:hypothetical protein
MAAVLDAYNWIADRFHVVRTRGEWVDTKCPFGHDNALVSWSVGGTGALCFKCWHGCGKLEILRAVGLSWKDAFPAGQDWGKVRRELTATYHYRDGRGECLYYKERWEPGYGGKDKTFVLRKSPGGEKGIDGCPRVLYRLPQLLAEPESPVFVVEGEKDCDSLARIGLLATCSISSSEGWGDHYAAPLTGRELVIVADDDATGWKHAAEVAGAMIRHRAASIRLLSLPENDVTAFLNGLRMQGVNSANELQERLWAIVLETPEWRPT